MSAGQTFLEGVQFDTQGRLLRPTPHGYSMMTDQAAAGVFSGLMDAYEPRGRCSAKEIGEAAALPVHGAAAQVIANITGI